MSSASAASNILEPPPTALLSSSCGLTAANRVNLTIAFEFEFEVFQGRVSRQNLATCYAMTTTCVLHFASAVPQTVEYHVGHAVLDHGARHLSDQSVIRQEPSVFPPDV